MSKIYLITGALGAGKTTFLKKILTQYKAEKTGVLINEFGAVGMDGDVIENEGFESIELTNGSIFCSCLKDYFIDGLVNLIESELDYIFIESSGLSDPSNMKSIIEIVKKKTDKTFTFIGSICLADALYFEKQFEVLVSIERQIEKSSLLILNKCDMVNEENLNHIEKIISDVNPELKIYRSEYAELPKEVLEALSENKALTNDETINREDNKPSIFRLKFKDSISLDKLKSFIDEIKIHTFRIKGFVEIEDENYKLDSVMDSLNLEKYKGQGEKELVVMSSIGFGIISKITDAGKKTGMEFSIVS